MLGALGGGTLLIVGLAALGWWHMIRMPGASHRGELPPADEALAALAGELRADVATLAGKIGHRHAIAARQRFCDAAEWIETELARIGYPVEVQEYTALGLPCWNFAVEVRGAAIPEEIVVIGAHYDSAINTPGANDNASGVAALLALARRFFRRPADRTLRFVAFANEEPPHFRTEKMGSWVYARTCRKRGDRIAAMISLETIGYYDDAPNSQRYPTPFSLFYPSVGNFVAFVGNTGSADLVRRSVAAFRRHEPFPSEGAALPGVVRGVGFSDHWAFWQEGYPAVMVTDTAMFRYPHYHEPTDTPDQMDYDRLARVVRGLEHVVLALANQGDAQSP